MTADAHHARQLVIVAALLLCLAGLTGYTIWGSWPSSSTTSAAPVTSIPTVTQTRTTGGHD